MQGSSYEPIAASDRGNMLEEPGAEDNRITLDPNDPRWAKTIGSWKDGSKYTLSSVIVEQMAPGDFRVLSFTADAGETAESEPEEEVDGGKAADLSAKEYPNPAVARLMSDDDKS